MGDDMRNMDAPKMLTLDGVSPKAAYLVYRDGGGGTVEIYDIFVDNALRKRGRGRNLLEKLFATVGEHVKVWAITRAENFIAQEFYEACKFWVIAPLRNFYGTRNANDNTTIDAIMYGRNSEGVV